MCGKIGCVLQAALYHGTSGTLGTNGTLLAPKTPKTTLKSRFLPAYLAAFRAKNTQFSPQKHQKTTIFHHFLPLFEAFHGILIAILYHLKHQNSIALARPYAVRSL